MASLQPFRDSQDVALILTLVSGSHIVNHMYLVLFPPILGMLAAEFDVTLATLGLVIGVQALTNTVFQLPYGYLADTYDRTLTMGLCLALGGGGVLLLAVAPTVEWLLIGQIVIGIGVAGHHPAHYPLLSDASTVENRGRAFSVHAFFGNIGFAAPPAIIVGIASLSGLNWRHAFAFMGILGVLYAAVAVYVLLAHVPPEIRKPTAEARPTSSKETVAARVRGRMQALVESPAILSLGILSLSAATVLWGVSTYVVTFLEQGYGVDSSIASLSLTAMYIVGAVFILVGGDLTDRYSPGQVIIAGYAAASVIIVLLASSVVSPLVAVAVAICSGSLCSFTLPARDKLTDLLSERADLGRNFAIITIGYMASQTIAPPLFGALIDSFGFRMTFVAIAGVSIVTVGLTAAIVTKWRDDFSVGTAVPDN